MPLDHRGCALLQWLVINGDQKGHVWNDDRADDAGIYPVLRPDGKPATFADWYLAWLESAGTKPIGDEELAVRTGDRASDWVVLAFMAFGIIMGIGVGRWNGLRGPYTTGIVVATALAAGGLGWAVDYLIRRLRRS